MRLLELCLLSLLSPQESAPTAATPRAPRVAIPAPPAAPAPAPAAPESQQDPAPQDPASPLPSGSADAAALAAQERAGAKADLAELARLGTSDDADVAARAAWLLGRDQRPGRVELLQQLVGASPHADARVFAMQALVRLGDVASTPTGIAALEDPDRRVRTLAAQLLGRLRRPAAREPLLALLDHSRTDDEPGPATDVQAALLALHDLEATDLLLRAATAVHDSRVEGAGTVLAYCCQGLSPKLGRRDELTFLLAILDHREPLVRRYAIGRLAELGERSTAGALEGRLAKEGNELRPLVEVAIAQIRKDKAAQPDDELQRALQNAQALLATAKRTWNGWTPAQQGMAAGVPVVLMLLLLVVRRGRRRAAAAAHAAATLAMVQPSEQFAEQAAAEAEALAAEAETAAETDDAEPIDTITGATPPAATGRWSHAGRRR